MSMHSTTTTETSSNPKMPLFFAGVSTFWPIFLTLLVAGLALQSGLSGIKTDLLRLSDKLDASAALQAKTDANQDSSLKMLRDALYSNEMKLDQLLAKERK